MKTLPQWYAGEEKISIEKSYTQLGSLIKLILSKPLHEGDCTNDNYSCPLCLLETILSEYYEYSKESK